MTKASRLISISLLLVTLLQARQLKPSTSTEKYDPRRILSIGDDKISSSSRTAPSQFYSCAAVKEPYSISNARYCSFPSRSTCSTTGSPVFSSRTTAFNWSVERMEAEFSA